MEKKTLMETLIEAGYPREEMHHHQSDLYVFAHIGSLHTRPIINEWYRQRGMNPYWHAKPFKDIITGRLMFDCAFAYGDYWEERSKCAEA